MKYMSLLVAVAICSHGIAQKQPLTAPVKPPSFPDITNLLALPDTSLSSSYHLPDGREVVTLPQDNMPCIVPDLSGFNMPDAGAYLKEMSPSLGLIPNPGITLLKPQKSTNTLPLQKNK